MAQSGTLYREDGKWKCRYRIKVDGKWKWAPSHTLGSIRDFPKKGEAKVAMDAFMAAQNKIGFRPETSARIVDFVENVYFPDIESGMYQRDPSTVKTHRGNWRKHLSPLLQNKMLRTFRPCDAEQVMVAIAKNTGNKLAHQTYMRLKSLLSGIFTHAIRKGVVDHNPITDSSVPEGKPFGRGCYAYSLAEIFQHLQLFDGQVKAIIAVVAFAGLREGEVRGLWGPDDEGDRLMIRRSVWRSTVKDRCKTALSGSELEPAEVPIIGTLRKILDGVKHGSSWLFPNSNDGAIDLSNLVDRVIKPTFEAAGLQWYGWHAYRRGLASNLKELGVDDMVIQKILRHGDVGTTRGSYIKIRDSRVEAAMRTLDEACTAFVQPRDASGLVN